MSTFRQKVQATTNWVKPKPEDLEEAPRAPSRARSRKRPAAPVTAHRLFPAFAAAWFAALFGLGSLAIPASLLGAIVLKTGLPALVPAAAPPLGFTAHLLLAFVLALFGAAFGLALALRLRPRGAADFRPVEVRVPAAEPEADNVYKVRARDAHPDAPPRRPLVLTEAFADPLGEVAEPAEPLLRRKPGPSASEPVFEPIADTGPWIPEFTPGGHSGVRPLDLSALDLADIVDEPNADTAAEPAFAAPEAATVDAAAMPAETEPAPEPEVQPVEAPAAPVLLAATPQFPAGFAAALPDVSDRTWSPVAGAPLENLGIVQLIERLALAISAQKAANAAVINAGPEAEAQAAQPDLEPDFKPGPFSQPRMDGSAADVPEIGSAREAILRRLGAMASGDLAANPADGDVAPAPQYSRSAPAEAVVPLRPAAAAAAPSFATLAAPAGPAGALHADEALRSALATLQRMTARG